MFSERLPYTFTIHFVPNQYPPGTSYKEGSSEVILDNKVLIRRHMDVILGYENTVFHTKYCLLLPFKCRKTESVRRLLLKLSKKI